eukprot:147626_1
MGTCLTSTEPNDTSQMTTVSNQIADEYNEPTDNQMTTSTEPNDTMTTENDISKCDTNNINNDLATQQAEFILHIALIGVPGCGKMDVLDAYKSYNNNSKEKSKRDCFTNHPNCLQFKYLKWNIYAYPINADPSNWGKLLTKQANNGQLDCIALVVNASRLNAEVLSNEYSSSMVLSYWLRKHITKAPDTIVKFICAYCEQTCKASTIYKEFIRENYIECNYGSLLTKYPLGIHALSDEPNSKKSAVNIVRDALDLGRLVVDRCEVEWSIRASETNISLIKSDPTKYRDLLRVNAKETVRLIDDFCAHKMKLFINLMLHSK